MKIFYDEGGKNGKYFELYDVEDFPKMKKIKGIFSNGVTHVENIDFNYSLENIIDGSYAFYWNWNLESFNSNLSKLENGTEMFRTCVNLISFTSKLPSLTNGEEMFYGCNNLTTFSSDLSSLTNGVYMFASCSALNSFTSKLPSLTNGEEMFYGCNKLTTFSSDLPRLIDGNAMFRGSLLSTFNSNLSNLLNGHWMFDGCRLNETSLRNIADNINNLVENGYDKAIEEDWKYEVLGVTKTISKSYRGRIDIDLHSSVTEEVKIECGNKLIDKGWDVYFNGTLYEYTIPCDVSEANGYIPDAYKNGSDSWNTVVLIPNIDVLKISRVNEKGEMLNDD